MSEPLRGAKIYVETGIPKKKGYVFTEERVKSAVKFYKRYRDNIDRLFKEEKSIYDIWFKFIEQRLKTEEVKYQIGIMNVYYNDWLFDYCFNDAIK